MKILLKCLAFIAFVLACGWTYKSPGYDSIIAAVTALLALLGLFISGKRSGGNLNQKIGDNSFGIQAGGNISIGKTDKE